MGAIGEATEHVPGGSGGVWLSRTATGDLRVHRETGPWTQAVHALLEHLEQRGVPGVPTVVGFDREGREVLDYVPGQTPDPAADLTDDTLRQAASWLRDYQAAVREFNAQGLVWREGAHDPGPEQIICHNDPGTYNWVVDGERFIGLIDWDRAGPGDPLDDFAFMCWTGVPLSREIDAERAAERLTIAAEAYGGITPEALLDAVDRRMRLVLERWEAGIERQDPGTLQLRELGIMDQHVRNLASFAARTPALRECLARLGA